MFVGPLKNVTLPKAMKHVRTFSVTKIFDVTLRRGYAEDTSAGDSSSCDESFKALDVCPTDDKTSTGKLSHNSLKPPPEISPCIFRKFSQADEQLGSGADKCGEYKNAEYYGYHIYSYTNILVQIFKMQQMREKAGNKPCPPINKEETDKKSAAEAKVSEKKTTEESVKKKTSEQSVKSKETNKCDDGQESKLRMVPKVANEPKQQMIKKCDDGQESKLRMVRKAANEPEQQMIKKCDDGQESKLRMVPKVANEPEQQMIKKCDDDQESKLRMFCKVANEPEHKPCKSLPDEEILACSSDSETSDDEKDNECKDKVVKVEDNTFDEYDGDTKKNKDGDDDEC